MSIRFLIVAAAAGVAVFSGHALAGPLDPPAGPIAPTPGPEARIAINATNTPGDADSHFRIAQPGSYYLTGNISLPSTEKAIEIEIGVGQQVTIDLNGFSISASDAARAAAAIAINASEGHVVVRNGSIRNWSSAITQIGGSISVEDVKAHGSRLTQFNLREATVTRCAAENGDGLGFQISGAGAVTGCLARANAGTGFRGAIGVVMRDCSANLNGGDGFDLGQGIAESCVSQSNALDGFVSPGVIVNCTSLTNGGHGISCGVGGTVRACTVVSNEGSGIRSTSVVRIEGNVITSNNQHGVEVLGSRTAVVGNIIGTNGRQTGVFAGVFCSTSDCTIDSNEIVAMTLGGDDYGIQVTGSSNLIIRNMISNVTTPLGIDAGNTSGGVSGTPSTAGPWTNITY